MKNHRYEEKITYFCNMKHCRNHGKPSILTYPLVSGAQCFKPNKA